VVVANPLPGTTAQPMGTSVSKSCAMVQDAQNKNILTRIRHRPSLNLEVVFFRIAEVGFSEFISKLIPPLALSFMNTSTAMAYKIGLIRGRPRYRYDTTQADLLFLAVPAFVPIMVRIEWLLCEKQCKCAEVL
jgi:hypothetical protein